MELEHQHQWHLPNPDAEPNWDSEHTDPDSNSHPGYPNSNRDHYTISDALHQRCDCGRRV